MQTWFLYLFFFFTAESVKTKSQSWPLFIGGFNTCKSLESINIFLTGENNSQHDQPELKKILNWNAAATYYICNIFIKTHWRCVWKRYQPKCLYVSSADFKLKVNLGLTDADVAQENITETMSGLAVLILIGEGRIAKPRGRGVSAFSCIY